MILYSISKKRLYIEVSLLFLIIRLVDPDYCLIVRGSNQNRTTCHQSIRKYQDVV